MTKILKKDRTQSAVFLKSVIAKGFDFVEDCSVQFNSGFNVLTGESGAGKSQFFAILGLLIGDKFPARLKILDDRAFVQTVIYVPSDHIACGLLASEDIVLEEDLCLRRVINKTLRSSFW